jgi:hypothetical protein
MNPGGKSPQNEQRIRREVQDNFEREKIAQGYMDRFYAERGHKIKDRQGDKKRDLVLTKCKDGQEKDEQVEEKFRFMNDEHGGYADILIEIIQDLVSGDPGWFTETGCDSLHYVLCTNENIPFKLYRIAPWKEFRDWWFNYLKRNKQQKAVVSAKGYGLTINLSLEPRDMSSELITQYDLSFEENNQANGGQTGDNT